VGGVDREHWDQVLLQIDWRPMAGKGAVRILLPRVYLIVSMGAILSEAHSIYGLLLTLLSGSIFYVIGFTLVTLGVHFYGCGENSNGNLANV